MVPHLSSFIKASLTKYLKTLMDLDLVEREVPVTEENPEKSKKGLFRIKETICASGSPLCIPI